MATSDNYGERKIHLQSKTNLVKHLYIYIIYLNCLETTILKFSSDLKKPMYSLHFILPPYLGVGGQVTEEKKDLG